jgi:ribonuclease HI
LEWIKKNLPITDYQLLITFFLDSKLIVNQLNGLYKIKNSVLRNLIIKVRQLEKEVNGNVSYRFVSREKNRQADLLVNRTISKLLV